MTSARPLLRHVIVLTTALLSVCATARERHVTISLEEAKKAGEQVLRGPWAGSLLVAVARQFIPGFYVFEVQSSNPIASPHVGSFAVNARTGDVWDMAGYCMHLTSPSLRKLQADIRRRFKLEHKAYQELRVQKPMCDAE